jgi:hypothetical protein
VTERAGATEDREEKETALSSQEDAELQESYREEVKKYDEIDVDLRGKRVLQRSLLVCLVGAIVLTFLLGYTVIIGLWDSKPQFTRWAGLVIVISG